MTFQKTKNPQGNLVGRRTSLGVAMNIPEGKKLPVFASKLKSCFCPRIFGVGVELKRTTRLNFSKNAKIDLRFLVLTLSFIFD